MFSAVKYPVRLSDTQHLGWVQQVPPMVVLHTEFAIDLSKASLELDCGLHCLSYNLLHCSKTYWWMLSE